MEREAVLILEDGTQYRGRSFGYEKSVSGELVFYTAMTGYPESLSDPSYNGPDPSANIPVDRQLRSAR